MQNPISPIWSRAQSWFSSRMPRGLAGATFWLAVWFCFLLFLRSLPGGFGIFIRVLQVFVGIALVSVFIPWCWQLIRRHMLWSLRNKLILTYLLIGLAPFLLLVTLVLISSYIAAGQFAIHLVDTRIQAELDQMSAESAARAARIGHFLESPTFGKSSAAAAAAQSQEMIAVEHVSAAAERRAHPRINVEVFLNSAPVRLPEGSAYGTPLGLPAWATNLRAGAFRGVVSDADTGEIFLVVIDQQRLNDGRVFTLLSSMPVNTALMDSVAGGLGRATLFAKKNLVARRDGQANRSGLSNRSVLSPISGGSEPPHTNIADVRVRFVSTTTAVNWEDATFDVVPVEVFSRPSLLYLQLFGASLSGIVTSAIRIGLISLCILFTIIECFALWMALRLSRTITASVADLYRATLQVDRGELDHQIVVKRDDQLAELSRSFNRMTGSLRRLLVEQKEKERLQNEISIAQEVQANLFPHRVHDLQTLQLHGICRPARSVSGDYYDFLIFHRDGPDNKHETGVAIALGDISGKGISAALLMATLHSAVRAYRFASEALVYSESSVAGLTASKEELGGDHDKLFESPGRILSLLNRHLYRSTQPEKYATLFLAHYDVDSSVLTYSNAGQLPPLVLGADGAIRRLDKGGTVVGLMDGMRYEEGRIRMRSGDILVAYSDGVTEPENDFGDFGEERLMEVVSRYRDQPLHVISNQVMLALDAWIGAEEQPDDITLVLARQI